MMDSEKLKETLEKHKLWFDGVEGGVRANLSGAVLRGADLREANLSEANLSRANLIEANLSGANLSEANLSRANLIEANLSGANLSGAVLIGANLSGANLIEANLSGAVLIGANLRGANLSRADLRGANLRCTIGNRRELKSLQVSSYTVCYTEAEMAIGCQQFPLEAWLSFGDADISRMASDALEWWAEWKPKLTALGVFDTVLNKQKEGNLKDE